MGKVGANGKTGRPPKHPAQIDNSKSKRSKQNLKAREDAVPTADRNLVCPDEFKDIEYAKLEWKRIVELDDQLTKPILNNRHIESLKSYCIAVARRKELIEQWIDEGKVTTYETDKGVIKDHPIPIQIDKLGNQIDSLANSLCLTVLSEARMGTANARNTDTEDDDIIN